MVHLKITYKFLLKNKQAEDFLILLILGLLVVQFMLKVNLDQVSNIQDFI